MLTILLLSILGVYNPQQPDSIKHEWLLNEWKQTYESNTFQFTTPGQVIIVSLTGEVIHQFDKEVIEFQNQRCSSDYQKSDYLFTLNNDDYYLLTAPRNSIQPVKTYPYSSAE